MKTRLLTVAVLGLLLGTLAALVGQVPPSGGNAALLKTSPTSTNKWSVTTKAARVYSVTAVNISATDTWLHLVNTNAGSVADGAVAIVAPIKITAGATGGYNFGEKGCPFSVGLTVIASTTPSTITNTSSTTNFVFTVVYDGNPN